MKVAKRALQTLGKLTNLTFSEFLTALHMADNLANERPIDARIQSREDCLEYVTPNLLLLGRASHSGDSKSFDLELPIQATQIDPGPSQQVLESMVPARWPKPVH